MALSSLFHKESDKKLWILQPKACQPDDDPWASRWDMCYGQIIQAKTALAARKLANQGVGAEKGHHPNVWLNPKYTSCQMLKLTDDEHVIMVSFVNG